MRRYAGAKRNRTYLLRLLICHFEILNVISPVLLLFVVRDIKLYNVVRSFIYPAVTVKIVPL